jgi:transglutaminase-like putative cysteine protease
MRIQRATPVNELLARAVFLLLPTLVVCYFILWNANQYYSLLREQHWLQTGYVACGMLAGAIFYSFRFRFLPAFLILIFVFQGIYKGIDATAIGDIDAFFIANQFRVFTFTFVAGWLIGWGFVRLRFFSVFLATSFLVACVILIAKQSTLIDADTTQDQFMRWAAIFAPVVIYAVYIIFAAELIRNYKDKSQQFWWFLTRRLVLFAGLSILLMGGVIWYLQEDIKGTLEEFGGGAQRGENSMLKRNKDGTFDLEQYNKLRGNLSRNNELLFAARIDNFFPDSDVPNPLYLTAFYYSKFDTLTETFERDSIIPANDLFEPNPSKIPLYFTKTDSSVLDYALRERYRRTVEIEVYKKSLAPATFVAPSTAFFIQPIAIEKDFQSEFKSAYRAKSYISELNSAYFVYNIDDPAARAFQEQRFEALRSVRDYVGVDADLMRYYTFMPSEQKYAPIRSLAQEVTKGRLTPVDKVLAIRDYFLSKDENGEPLFTYSDNPGIPDIPNASRLMYFLFENRKGYCAYYAGATLFMLRSLGIPSRITVGFLTQDRSSKNKGWYWYYADQAHAWVQVYFPGFGWLDFDTTVGNDEARESSQPDGTPPMQPPKAYLAADGVISRIDTTTKQATLKLVRMVYHDDEYTFDEAQAMDLDLSIAEIKKDSVAIAVNQLSVGDSATAVSFAEVYKNRRPIAREKGSSLITRLPNPAPVDELYVKQSKEEKKQVATQQVTQENALSWRQILWIALAAISGIVLIMFLSPTIVLMLYKFRCTRARTTPKKAYWAYRWAQYYVHQLGFVQASGTTAMQYAQGIDQRFPTNFTEFMVVYLKLKYAHQPLSEQEIQVLHTFQPKFYDTVKHSVAAKHRLISFLNIMRMIVFFSKSGQVIK